MSKTTVASVENSESHAPPGRVFKRSSRRSSKQKSAKPLRPRVIVLGIAGIVLFMVALDLIRLIWGISENSLPESSAIVLRLLQLPFDAAFMVAVGQTLWVSLAGLVLAICLAVPLGVLLGTSNPTYKAISALIEFMRPIPPVALIPPVLLIMGTGSSMKIVLVVYTTFWIILFNTIYAIRGVEPGLKEAARVFGTHRIKSLAVVSLPSAAPFIFTGIQVAATASIIVTIATEMIAGGSGGVGQWLMDNLLAVTRRADVFAGAFATGVLGLMLTGALSLIGRVSFPWSVANRGGAE